MEVVYECCCGLDIHKKTVVACVVVPGPRQATAQGDPHVQYDDRGSPRTRRLADGTAGDTRCARKHGRVLETSMWNVLESSFTMLLVNARHIKQVPGRKTDEWIADLLRHGLLRASFVPDRPQRELRELTRYRTTLVRERSAERSRIQKTLKGAGIKLGDVASDVLGASGRQMLEALVRGVTDASLVAELAKGSLRGKRPQLVERALTGQFGAHQRF